MGSRRREMREPLELRLTPTEGLYLTSAALRSLKDSEAEGRYPDETVRKSLIAKLKTLVAQGEMFHKLAGGNRP